MATIKKAVAKKVAAKKPVAKTKAKGPKPKVKPREKLPEKVIKYLESRGVPHNLIEHRTVYTALDAAATMKKKMEEIVKSLLVKADKDYYLVLLPADHSLDFAMLAKTLAKHTKSEVKSIKIPGEKIVDELMKAKKISLSAFGGLHDFPVVLENKLAKLKKAVFSSGSHNHSLELAVKDFIKSEQPILGAFGNKKKIKLPPKPKAVKKVAKKPVKKVVKKKVVLKKKK